MSAYQFHSRSRVGCKVRRNADQSRAAAGQRGVTIIELIIVIMIILILAGLVLSVGSYVQNKGARARAETEIAAMSAALESYKADNGIYPRGKSVSIPPSGNPTYSVASTGTDDLDARVNTDPSQKIYQDAARYLYEQLSGDTNLDLSPEAGNKTYFAFRPSMLALIRDSTGKVVGLSHIRDPFGNSYGYSTAQAANPGGNAGYNPTYDLWSAGSTASPTPTPPAAWIKNW